MVLYYPRRRCWCRLYYSCNRNKWFLKKLFQNLIRSGSLQLIPLIVISKFPPDIRLFIYCSSSQVLLVCVCWSIDGIGINQKTGICRILNGNDLYSFSINSPVPLTVHSIDLTRRMAYGIYSTCVNSSIS